MQPLPNNPQLVPRGRWRGARRQFRNLQRRIEAHRFETDPAAWWDLWHTHVDWRGRGNGSWSCRLDYLHLLAAWYAKISAWGAATKRPFQSWIALHEEDAGQDAVYLHTPNPHGTPFPWIACTLPDPDSPLRATFERLLPDLELRFARRTGAVVDEIEGTTHASCIHLIWSPSVGASLAASELASEASSPESSARDGVHPSAARRT